MGHRFLFYVPNRPEDTETIALSGEENHHLFRVLRIAPGEEVHLTDGRGGHATCRVLRSGSGKSLLEITRRERSQPPEPKVTLALGCPRKSALEEALVHGTELGLAVFQPLHTDKSMKITFSPSYRKRLERLAREAMKQSFRFWSPQVKDPTSLEEFLRSPSGATELLVGWQGAEPLEVRPRRGEVTAIVGPEGGFTEREERMLRARGARFVSLSAQRLRSETAASAFLCLLCRPFR